MELSMKSKREIVERVCGRYRKASKSGKSDILLEFTQTTGYTRKYAAWLLGNWGKVVTTATPKGPVRFKVGERKTSSRSGRPPVYDQAFIAVLKELWFLFDCLCGKRFVPMIRALMATLTGLGYFTCEQAIQDKLVQVSPATVDRLLAAEKRKLMPRGNSLTRPGSLLKRQIAIRTFADWSDAQPGFVEADLVAHDGGSAYGDFLCTLTMTDVGTGWTEIVAVTNKAQRNVFPGLQFLRERLPFPLLGLDTDNGSEFVNKHLIRYCQQEHITFTRSRPYRKNDSCFVEQKNNSVVRRSVGYSRFESPQALAAINSLYEQLRLLVNFVYPSAKLVSKEREGSKVIRVHDTPMTPFQRVMLHPAVSESVKEKLMATYSSLDPVCLARTFKARQDALIPLAAALTNPFKPYKVFHASTPSASPSP